MFKKLFSTLSYTDTSEDSNVELDRLQNNISNWEQKANIIKSQFNFHLPDYIVDEIIQNEGSKNYINLHYLINCALVNNKISESNANLLKQVYSFRDCL